MNCSKYFLDYGNQDLPYFEDFMTRGTMILEQVGCINGDKMCKVIFDRMADKQYHGPHHVLAMWGFGDHVGGYFPLSTQIAVLFHDFVHGVDNAEEQSSKEFEIFAHSEQQFLLTYRNSIIPSIKEQILATSKYMEPQATSYKNQYMLDLDMCSFAMDFDQYMIVNYQVTKEFGIEDFKKHQDFALDLFRNRGNRIFLKCDELNEIAKKNINQYRSMGEIDLIEKFRVIKEKIE